MINKKFCITMSGFVIASLMLTGCSSMFSNPMKYVISQDETRQEQTESQNDTGNNDTSSDEQILSEEDNENHGIYILGTDKMSDYSVSGMLKAVKEINENIDDDKTKGIILIGDEQYMDYLSYFISLTVEDKKPLVIIKNLNDDTKQAELINQVKMYINGNADSLPDGCIVNRNSQGIYDLSDSKALPDVDIIYDYPGKNVDGLSKDIYINDGTVVVSSMNNAVLFDDIQTIISQNNIGPVVVTCSIDTLKSGNLKDYGDNVYYTDMEPFKARILLMLLLNNKSDQDSIKKAFMHIE